MRPQPDDIAPICANCRLLEEYPHSDERSRLRSWCRLWRLLIPDPRHTGCTAFQPKDSSSQEPSNP